MKKILKIETLLYTDCTLIKLFLVLVNTLSLMETKLSHKYIQIFCCQEFGYTRDRETGQGVSKDILFLISDWRQKHSLIHLSQSLPWIHKQH